MARDPVADAVIAAGHAVAMRHQIRGGVDSEAWSVTTTRGQQLIVRISRHRNVAAECWAIDRARQAGFPAPRVLWAEGAVSVQERVPGRALSDLPDVPADRRRSLLGRVGRLLARLHRIETTGFGSLDAQGRGPFATWDEFVLHEAPRFASLPSPDGARVRLESNLVERALRELTDHLAVFAAAPSRLLHADVALDHIFVDENVELTGVIDFGDASAGDPAFDVARWAVLHEPEWPTRWLLDGYAEEGGLADDIELRLWLHRLFIAVVLGSVGPIIGREDLVSRSHAVLEADLPIA
jgi:aminoglycoside phosphotransferase (APT) family kinase protein